MIRLYDQGDTSTVRDLLRHAPEQRLLFEDYTGRGVSTSRLYVDENGSLCMIAFGRADFLPGNKADPEEWDLFFHMQGDLRELVTNRAGLALMKNTVGARAVHPYILFCMHPTPCEDISPLSGLRHADGMADLRPIYDLLLASDAFSLPPFEDFYAERQGKFNRNATRTLLIQREGKVVATASATTENPNEAMLGAICVDENCRGEKFGRHIVTALINELFREGKTLYIATENPIAEKLYRSLGFQEISEKYSVIL